ncbi:glutaredoxin domain-containing protein [Treponema pectinovorum]|uniref:glutaredoxin domain-containing protein n=1 Tax=Treponema pectinovorum TaxID=164 RepID=UPI0011CA49DD|nr:glutaredoxin domain-containing protein [Treponema pectinovorum]
MIKIYGSKMCPDCRACEFNFKNYGIEYEYLDVTESLKNLKQFLIYRDSDKVFDRLKAIHDIGLPACVGDDGKIFTDWESFLKEKGLKVLTEEGVTVQACSLDRKGC